MRIIAIQRTIWVNRSTRTQIIKTHPRNLRNFYEFEKIGYLFFKCWGGHFELKKYEGAFFPKRYWYYFFLALRVFD